MREKSRVFAGLTALFVFAVFSGSAASGAAGVEDVSMEKIAKRVVPSVVKVETRNGRNRVATGVVIDKDGYIVTTALISPRDQEILVTTSDGRRTEAKFLGWDSETRLALLQAKEKNLTPITLARTGDLGPGAWIGIISLSPENTPSVTQGIVSSVAPDRLRLNVWVTRGSSGSPVVDKDGQMVALLRGIYTEDQPVVFEFREQEVVGSGYVFDRAEAPSSGMALGIPVDIVKSIAGEIKETGKVSRPWLGVAIGENDKGQVVVGNVETDSPAEMAKLKEGDVILAIDGKNIGGAANFVSEIRSRKPGQDIDLKVEREGKPVSLRAKLGEYPEAEARKELEAWFPRLFPPAQPALPRAAKPGEAPAPPRESKEFNVYTAPREPGARPVWGNRKYVGLYLEPLTKELLDYFGVKGETGLLVNRLTKDAPAEKAGIKVGDVIVRADGREVETVGDLSELIQDKKKGDKLKLEIIRDKKPMAVEVEVGEEEGPGLSELFKSMPSPEAWGLMGKDIGQEFERSRQVYEKYTTDQNDKLKKLAEEMKDQGKKYEELAKQYSLKGKGETEKFVRAVKAKNQIRHRV
jgi:S1-C subfamily serine protease